MLTILARRRSAPGELKAGQTYLSTYLLDRLAQLGVKPMFGVPGDVSHTCLGLNVSTSRDIILGRARELTSRENLRQFNLVFLDEVEKHDKIEWLGCCNEVSPCTLTPHDEEARLIHP